MVRNDLFSKNNVMEQLTQVISLYGMGMESTPPWRFYPSTNFQLLNSSQIRKLVKNWTLTPKTKNDVITGNHW